MLKPISAARIGNGGGFKVGGALVAALGLFVSCSASPVNPEMEPIGGALLAIGVTLVLVGFWIGLFSGIEQRLMDIQADLRQARSSDPAQPADPDLI